MNNKELLRDMDGGEEILIEGWSAKHVLGLIYQTVNCQRFRKRKQFIFVIRCSVYSNECNSLRILLEANPTSDQPGNGRISLNSFHSLVLTYEEVADKLDSCKLDASTLATALRVLFRSCGDKSVNQEIIHYIYFLLLFEIGRRMVVEKFASPSTKSYDCLPVAVTVAKIIDLFQRGILSPNDVFRDRRRYNIFKGGPQEREYALRNIEVIYRQNQEKDQQSVNYVQELESCFNPKHCS